MTNAVHNAPIDYHFSLLLLSCLCRRLQIIPVMMKQAETSSEKKKVMSNLASARALIQAGLDQASSVLALWADQVSELEKALEQINLADNSRTALRGTYQGRREVSQDLQQVLERMEKPGAQ